MKKLLGTLFFIGIINALVSVHASDCSNLKGKELRECWKAKDNASKGKTSSKPEKSHKSEPAKEVPSSDCANLKGKELRDCWKAKDKASKKTK